MMPNEQDGPEADGCELDFKQDADDDETAELRALFPDGDASTEEEWKALFSES
jgi:hypothetical protein